MMRAASLRRLARFIHKETEMNRFKNAAESWAFYGIVKLPLWKRVLCTARDFIRNR